MVGLLSFDFSFPFSEALPLYVFASTESEVSDSVSGGSGDAELEEISSPESSSPATHNGLVMSDGFTSGFCNWGIEEQQAAAGSPLAVKRRCQYSFPG